MLQADSWIEALLQHKSGYVQCVVSVQGADQHSSVHTVKSVCWCNNKQQAWSPVTSTFKLDSFHYSTTLVHQVVTQILHQRDYVLYCFSFGKAHAVFAFNSA